MAIYVPSELFSLFALLMDAALGSLHPFLQLKLLVFDSADTRGIRDMAGDCRGSLHGNRSWNCSGYCSCGAAPQFAQDVTETNSLVVPGHGDEGVHDAREKEGLRDRLHSVMGNNQPADVSSPPIEW